jgi:MFS family permease
MGGLVSIYYLGALVGCLWAGQISDKYGRKVAVFLGTLWAIIGAALLSGAQNASTLSSSYFHRLLLTLSRLVPLRPSYLRCWHRFHDQHYSLLGFGVGSITLAWKGRLHALPSELLGYRGGLLDCVRCQRT